MMATILGPEAFRAATDLYFARFDGTAATCDDFVDCMEEAGSVDLTQFRLWYTQAGTPRVVARLVAQTRAPLTLQTHHHVPPTPHHPPTKPSVLRPPLPTSCSAPSQASTHTA